MRSESEMDWNNFPPLCGKNAAQAWHQIEISYEPTNNISVTDLAFRFDGKHIRTKRAQFAPFKGLKIFGGEKKAAWNIILKDFKFGKFYFTGDFRSFHLCQ